VRELGVNSLVDTGTQPLLEGFITDITDWKMAEEQIQRQVRRFQALRTIDVAISAGPDLQFVLGVLLEQIMCQLNVDAAAILLQPPGMRQAGGFARMDSFIQSCKLEKGSQEKQLKRAKRSIFPTSL
jgi:hypothetical protein